MSLFYLYIGLYSKSNIFIYPLYIICIYNIRHISFLICSKYLSEEYFCFYHNFHKMEICQFCKKVCSGERGLSLHVYHSFECFQKLTDISKKYDNYFLSRTQANKSSSLNRNLPKKQYATHKNKKTKTSR